MTDREKQEKPAPLKRVRVNMPEESPARRAGLFRIQAEREGFRCACGTHQEFSAYTLAHWSEMLQHRCLACGRVHKVRNGAVQEISGPNKKPSRIKHQEGERSDPTKPLWRAYRILNNLGRPTTYAQASDYHETVEQANAQAYETIERIYPHSREKRDDNYRALIRQEEFPLLSTIATDGRIVGGGFLQSVGRSASETRGGSSVVHIELRDPKGRVSRIELLEEVWKEICDLMEVN